MDRPQVGEFQNLYGWAFCSRVSSKLRAWHVSHSQYCRSVTGETGARKDIGTPHLARDVVKGRANASPTAKRLRCLPRLLGRRSEGRARLLQLLPQKLPTVNAAVGCQAAHVVPRARPPGLDPLGDDSRRRRRSGFAAGTPRANVLSTCGSAPWSPLEPRWPAAAWGDR